jgi:glycine cleavage system H protein
VGEINGCAIPPELFYVVERHVWVKHLGSGLVRVGITSAGFKLAGGNLVAVTMRTKNVGQMVAAGKPIAMLESSKWVGPVFAPVPGVLLRGNEAVLTAPALALRDPYGEGWIAEMQVAEWQTAATDLLTGQPALDAYQALLDEEGIRCDG